MDTGQGRVAGLLRNGCSRRKRPTGKHAVGPHDPSYRGLVVSAPILDVVPQDDKLIVVEATGRCPPEDVGGPWGYADLLQAIDNPKQERHAELEDWIGTTRFRSTRCSPGSSADGS